MSIGIALVLIVFFVFGLACSSAKDQIEHKKVIVASTNDEWTSTRMRIMEGDLIVILASGTIRIGEWTGDVDANGTSGGEGALHGKIGVGAGFYLGSKNVWVSDTEGILKLKIRDGVYSDNSGNYEVTVLRIPPGAVPNPETVEAE
jgi:hypothetical protein